jgi:hypothetical protein
MRAWVVVGAVSRHPTRPEPPPITEPRHADRKAIFSLDPGQGRQTTIYGEMLKSLGQDARVSVTAGSRENDRQPRVDVRSDCHKRPVRSCTLALSAA